MFWPKRRNMGAHGAEISIQISALAWVEHRTLASSSHERDYCAPSSFSRLLRHAGGYSGTILTPEPTVHCILYESLPFVASCFEPIRLVPYSNVISVPLVTFPTSMTDRLDLSAS